MTDLYPDPPHLSVFVLPSIGPREALSASMQVVTAAGSSFSGDALVAQKDEYFRDVTDVERAIIRSRSSHDLLARRDLLRIQLRHKSIGVVALGFASIDNLGESHPLEVAVHAGALSLPVDIWSKSDRGAARRIMRWAEKLLVELAVATRATYGAIGVESRFPSPAGLTDAHRSTHLPTTWFWSSTVAEGAVAEHEILLSRLEHDAISSTKVGTIFRAWQPWIDQRIDVSSLRKVVDFLSRVVGQTS